MCDAGIRAWWEIDRHSVIVSIVVIVVVIVVVFLVHWIERLNLKNDGRGGHRRKDTLLKRAYDPGLGTLCSLWDVQFV